MRYAALVALAACGRLGFDARDEPGAPDGGGGPDASDAGDANDASDATCDPSIGGDTVALYTFDDDLPEDLTGEHSGMVREGVERGMPRCGTAAAHFDTGYILVPDADDFDLATGSIEMFVRLETTATADNQTLIARDASGVMQDGHLIVIVTPAAELVARLQVGGISHHRCTPGFPTGSWVHVGVSFGGAADQGFRLWLDHVEATAPTATLSGGPVDCTETTAGGIAGNDNALVIGASNARVNAEGTVDPVTSQHVIDGDLDHVHIRSTWIDFGGQ